MRKLVTIRIDPQVWRTARELGLNISRTCENCLIAEIQRLTNSGRRLGRLKRDAAPNFFSMLIDKHDGRVKRKGK